MSVSSPPLRTVLLHRLDTMLGTNLSRQTQLISRSHSSPIVEIDETTHPDAVRQRQEDLPALAQGKLKPQAAGNRQVQGTPGNRLQQSAASLLPGGSTVPLSSAPATLGTTARLILALLDAYPEAAPALRLRHTLFTPDESPTGQPPKTAADRTDTDNRPNTLRFPAPSVLVRNLTQLIDQSGLFYESHLEQVHAGKRPITTLATEPQAAWSAGQTHTPAAEQALSDTHLMIRQQLDALANDALLLRGQAWPGTEFEWEIRRHSHEADKEEEANWSSVLTVHLPRLGTVETRLQLQGNKLQLHISATPQASEELNAAKQLLEQQLHTIGLHILQLFVQEST